MENKINLKMLASNARNTARNIARLTKSREAAMLKMDALKQEIVKLEAEIDIWEGPIKAITGGLTSSDIIIREVVDNKSVYKLRYPETVLPPNYSEDEFSDNQTLTRTRVEESAEITNSTQDTPTSISREDVLGDPSENTYDACICQDEEAEDTCDAGVM